MFVPYLLVALTILTPLLEVHSMSHNENQRKDHENLKEVLAGYAERLRLLEVHQRKDHEKLEESIRLFRELLRSMEDLKKDLDWHQAAYERSLTAAKIGGVFGTILCFTPLAPVGISIAGASVAIGGVTAYGDKMTALLAEIKLEELIEHIKKNSKNPEEILKIAKKVGMAMAGVGSTITTVNSVYSALKSDLL